MKDFVNLPVPAQPRRRCAIIHHDSHSTLAPAQQRQGASTARAVTLKAYRLTPLGAVQRVNPAYVNAVRSYRNTQKALDTDHTPAMNKLA